MEPKARLKPVKEFRIYKRNLPHWELPGSVYFITFRTITGLNLSDSAKDIALSSFNFHAGKKYKLHACVIMDTHVHCILQPLEELQAGTPVQPSTFYSLAQIMHSIKSYSANRIQRLSLFTLLTQVVFKHIDHPGYRVTAILHFNHLLRQRLLFLPWFQLSSVAPAGEHYMVCLVDDPVQYAFRQHRVREQGVPVFR